MSELVLGIDLGGTTIKCGVVDAKGSIRGRGELPTGAGVENAIVNMVRGAHLALVDAGVTLDAIGAVGVAAPGAISTADGTIFSCANLAGWKNVPLRGRIATVLNKPAMLVNDANAAAYGEFWAGAGRGGGGEEGEGIKDMIMLTLGTGVGGGIIRNGRVVHGSADGAGEFGHSILVPDGEPCACGQRGCLEVYTSPARIARRATDMLIHQAAPSTLRQVLDIAGQITAADVAEHARQGDAMALDIWETACKYLALACVNIAHTLDPQIIVLGGGMSRAGDYLLDSVRTHFQANYWKLAPPKVRIALATLGNDAGMIGAAGLAIPARDREAIPEIGR